jgi:hypothetical protein
MDEKEIQNNISQKQQYLRDEIMNQGYDINEFSEFMSEYKENGLDIINWSLDELKEVVKKFKNKDKVKSKEEEEQLIEKGVENIRQSYILNQIEYPNLDMDNNISSSKNNNININYDYKVINFNNLKNSNIYDNNSPINNNLNVIAQNNPSGLIQNEQIGDNINKTDSNQKEYSEFEILDDNDNNNNENIREKIPCVKQKENSLTKYNNLQVILEA